MNKFAQGIFAFGLAVCQAVAAAASDEQQALVILQSAAPAVQKEAACVTLKGCGGPKSVPVLKMLLRDEALAQWALDALETMPAPEAGDALLAALPTVTGKTKAGVISALGSRRDARAMPELARLLYDSDPFVPVAAALALGKIGDAAAIVSLRSSHTDAPGPLRTALINALLVCADRLLAKGNANAAAGIYSGLRHSDSVPVRAAVFRGQVFCAGKGKAELVAKALSGPDEVEQTMAVQLVRELPDRNATKTFADALPNLSPPLQVAVLEALRQRGDPSAAKQVATLTRANDASVRIAALKALGELGDASQVPLLARIAANNAAPAERSEARAALTSLRRGLVLSPLLAYLKKAPAGEKIELVRALARRAERVAVPDLLVLAARADGELGVAVFQALEKLADDRSSHALCRLIVQARNDSIRGAAVSAFVAVAKRSKTPTTFSALALRSLPNAATPARCALLAAAGQIGGPGVLDALRAAAKDADAAVSDTALRTMAENAGDEARPDLLILAQASGTERSRAIALGGYWRLVEDMTTQPLADRLAAVRAGLDSARTPADQKLGLARLAELPDPAALELARPYRRNPAVRDEAEAACLQIATRLDANQLALAQLVLRDLVSSARQANVRSAAATFIAALESRAGYVTPWLVSGPYRQQGKEAKQLFDVTFAPESGAAQKPAWRPLTTASSMTNCWWADLAPVAGGNHCVVYLKARVFCPKTQPVSLAIGSDDGVKLWINGALIHANNAARNFKADQDKAGATLSEGWNDLLVKITQQTAGCGAAIRIRDADGKPVSGLRVEAKE